MTEKKNYVTPTCKWIACQADVITSSLAGTDFYGVEQNPWESTENTDGFTS